MQYHIDIALKKPNLLTIQQALSRADPACVVDMDRLAGKLQISTWLALPELVKVVDASGFAVDPNNVKQIPSECCGGCGGCGG